MLGQPERPGVGTCDALCELFEEHRAVERSAASVGQSVDPTLEAASVRVDSDVGELLFEERVATGQRGVDADTHPLTERHEAPSFSGGVWKTAQVIKREYGKDFEISTIPALCGVSVIRKAGGKYF